MAFRMLALDLATSVGWTAGEAIGGGLGPLETIADGFKPEVGGVRSFEGNSRAVLFDHYQSWVRRMLAEHMIDGIIFESPMLSRGKTTVQTARILMGLCGLTEMLLPQRYVRWMREGKPQEVRKHFLGERMAKKPDVIAACRARGWIPADHNHADAMALFSYGCTLI